MTPTFARGYGGQADRGEDESILMIANLKLGSRLSCFERESRQTI
jgi:hypothetical protein